MRIVFMGTPEFAVPSLESLVNSKYEVVMAVTQPDKPKGRGYRVCCPPVKQYALSKGIPVFQPEKMLPAGKTIRAVKRNTGISA